MTRHKAYSKTHIKMFISYLTDWTKIIIKSSSTKKIENNSEMQSTKSKKIKNFHKKDNKQESSQKSDFYKQLYSKNFSKDI